MTEDETEKVYVMHAKMGHSLFPFWNRLFEVSDYHVISIRCPISCHIAYFTFSCNNFTVDEATIWTYFSFSAEFPTFELENLGHMTSQRFFKHQFGICEQSSIRFRGQIHDPSVAVRFADTLPWSTVSAKLKYKLSRCTYKIVFCTHDLVVFAHILS